jgi:virginiamycin B lyase
MRYSPSSIAFDSRGLAWFVCQFDNLIGFIGPGGKGKYLFLPHKDSWPDRIVRGPDGAMWFTEYHGDRIGRIDGRGKISEFRLGTGCCPQDIVAGRRVDLWFSDNGDSAISRITVNGIITRYPIDSVFGQDDVQGLAVDRDGSLLFADTSMSIHSEGYVTRAILRP